LAVPRAARAFTEPRVRRGCEAVWEVPPELDKGPLARPPLVGAGPVMIREGVGEKAVEVVVLPRASSMSRSSWNFGGGPNLTITQ